MSRTLHGRVVLKLARDVLVTGGQTACISSPVSHPSVYPLLLYPSSSIQSTLYRRLHFTPPQSCHRASIPSVLSVPSAPLPSIPLFLSARLSTSPQSFKIRSIVDGAEPPKSKKKQYNAPFITLIDTEDNISRIGLDQAERLAKRRDLKLVKVEDPNLSKGGKDVYRLMTGKQYYEEEVKFKKTKNKHHSVRKDEKNLNISTNITQHDLAFKLHSVVKWLNKGHQVKVTITSRNSSKGDLEKVFSTIEEEVSLHNGRIVQRHEKMDDLRFYIVPPKGKEETSEKKTPQEDEHPSSDESRSDDTK